MKIPVSADEFFPPQPESNPTIYAYPIRILILTIRRLVK